MTIQPWLAKITEPFIIYVRQSDAGEMVVGTSKVS